MGKGAAKDEMEKFDLNNKKTEDDPLDEVELGLKRTLIDRLGAEDAALVPNETMIRCDTSDPPAPPPPPPTTVGSRLHYTLVRRG